MVRSRPGVGSAHFLYTHTHRQNHHNQTGAWSPQQWCHSHPQTSPAWPDQHSPSRTLFSHYLCITVPLPLLWRHSHAFLYLDSSATLCHLLRLLHLLVHPSVLLADVILSPFVIPRLPAVFWRVISPFDVLVYQLVPLITWNSLQFPPFYSIIQSASYAFKIIWVAALPVFAV